MKFDGQIASALLVTGVHAMRPYTSLHHQEYMTPLPYKTASTRSDMVAV